jgi:IS5 family transposase
VTLPFYVRAWSGDCYRTVRILITEGPRADCTQALPLVEGLRAQALFADRAYDTDAIIERATGQEMEVVIPPKKNRKVHRQYDRDLYKLRQRARKCVSNPQAMARHCDTLRKKLLLLPRCRPNPMHCSVG